MTNYDNILKALIDFGLKIQSPNELYMHGEYEQRAYNGKNYLCKIHKCGVFQQAIGKMSFYAIKTKVNNNTDVINYLLRHASTVNYLNTMYRTTSVDNSTELAMHIINNVFIQLYDETQALKEQKAPEQKAIEKANKKTPEQKAITTADKKPKKKTISQLMKRRVWAKHIGEEIGKHKCLCCNMTDITQLTFNCGHIVAEANGGTLSVDNLLPICQSCNSSMGTQNLYTYKLAHGL